MSQTRLQKHERSLSFLDLLFAKNWNHYTLSEFSFYF